MALKHRAIFENLQEDILRLEGHKSLINKRLTYNLGVVHEAFPDACFPFGLHEFISQHSEDLAATCGFVSGLLNALLSSNGTVLWVSPRLIFPPALRAFGLHPDRFIFSRVQNEEDIIWTMNEALKCNALSCVIGELQEISFTQSRKLQLSVEQSQVTGFILHHNYKKLNPTACVSRWKISHLNSEATDNEMPGIGFSKWRVELLRIRNGRPGAWDLFWRNQRFETVHVPMKIVTTEPHRKAG